MFCNSLMSEMSLVTTFPGCIKIPVVGMYLKYIPVLGLDPLTVSSRLHHHMLMTYSCQ